MAAAAPRRQVNADGLEFRELAGHTDTVCAIAISPDGALLASGSNDRTCRLWHLPSGSPVGVLQTQGWSLKQKIKR